LLFLPKIPYVSGTSPAPGGFVPAAPRLPRADHRLRPREPEFQPEELDAMPKLAFPILLLALLLLQQGAGNALAQGGVVPAPTVAEQQGETEVSPDDGGFDWGWLGLIGLAGLAGLAGRRRF